MSDGDDDPEASLAEPEPEADLPDPESELPTVPDVPEVDVPEVVVPEADVPGELLRDFWTTVAVFNVALLAASVGVMMLVFDVYRPFGAALLVLGLLSGVRGYLKYRALAGERGPDDGR